MVNKKNNIKLKNEENNSTDSSGTIISETEVETTMNNHDNSISNKIF
jgi:hypothetical protein